MQKTNFNETQEAFYNALLYGQTGNGKTYSARTLPEGKTAIISTEKKLLNIKDMKFDFYQPENWQELRWLYKNLSKNPHFLKKYDYVLVDSLTEVNEMCKEYIVNVERRNKKTNIGQVYDEALSMQDWGLLSIKMSKFVRYFRDLKYNVIITALEDKNKDETTGKITVAPSINGKLALNLGGFFDSVFRSVKNTIEGKTKYYFQTEGDQDSLCKNSTASLC